ncbi:GNAT family N-acetyltransferase [Romboutsia lituseburensis]|uniref:GNAT family N-acetyltransferase n=1 Tax=Romboutsia lituseburensis TaxID=1537 RepID=UPI00215B2C6E|nr:GNAT family N-acetyltransferase [Romboutsia lituseburensis]MCR8746836.1 GNAT family N-acetyltransferase [Romboutsia lituseburensis]
MEGNQVEEIIVLDITNTNKVVILNIAVNKCMQFKGIGSKLIDYSIESLNPKMLIAETDDDAVDFYKKYGFKIKSLGEKYGNCNRYECKYIC